LSLKKAAPHRVEYYCLNWTFSHKVYSVVEGSKDILYTDVFCVNLPTDFIQHAKVLKGGMQFISAMALPKWSIAELQSVKQMGGEYDNMHARVQACIRQVIQLVRWEDNSLKHWILGEPKVINLPIQCVDGDH
jgi:hypothetical protein